MVGDGVWVVEWSERTRADDTLVGDDDLHLTDPGREALAALLADVAGDGPQDAPGRRFPACVLVSTDDAVTSTTRASRSNDEDD